MNPLVQKLHALLFLSGSPIKADRLAKLTNVTSKDVSEALEELKTFLASSGLIIRTIDEGVQIVTSPDVAELTERFNKESFETNLSRTALESLTIIMYKGPITRPAIDYIRGMNSQYALQALLVRGIIERKDNPKDARSYLYSVSPKFCDYVGLIDSSKLPEFDDLHKRDDENISSALAELDDESSAA